MWGRFQELQKFETAKSGAAKASKRKSIDGKEAKVPKRRRKSLFTTFPRHHERNPTGWHGETARGPNKDKIDEFSSDEDFPDNKAKGAFRADDDSSKKVADCQSHHSEKARRKSAPLYLPKPKAVNDDEQVREQVINWSDSDNEEITSIAKSSEANASNNEQSILSRNDNARAACPGDARDYSVDEIEIFESPAKNGSLPENILTQPDSQVIIEECSPTPKSNDSHELRIKEENIDDYTQRPIDSTKKKRSRDLKGGLTEQLRKISAREKSDLVFWRHTTDKGGLKLENDCDTGSEILLLQVLSMEKDFSLSILRCNTLEANSKTVHIILPQEIDKGLKISENCLLEIHPPWKKVHVPRVEGIVLLSAYLLQTTTVIPTDGFAVNSRYDCLGCNTIEHPEYPPHKSGDIETAKNKERTNTRLATRSFELSETFDCDNLSGLSSFSAILIKANLVSKPAVPKFLGHSNKSILNNVKQVFDDKDNTTLELELVIKDKNDKIAIVRFPASNIDSPLSEHIFGSNGTKLAFTNFHLKDVKNIMFDQPILTILANTDLKTSRAGFCFMFSHTEKSNIAQQSQIKPVVNTMQPTEECNTLVKETENNHFIRLSMHVKCICTLPKPGNESPDENQCHFLMYVFKILDKIETANKTMMNNASSTYLVEKLPNCYVPKSVTKSLMQNDSVIYLQDLMCDLKRQHFVADKYTRICVVNEIGANEERGSGQYDLNECYSKHIVAAQMYVELLSRQPDSLENVSEGCRENDLVKVEGIIMGLDEDNATFWAVCADCGLESDNAMKESTFYCGNCNTVVKRTIHVQLEVYLASDTLGHAIISVKLLEKTVFDYLPMQISSEFRGYDTECIIGRRFGPSLCYCVQRRQENGTNASKPMLHLKLQEVKIAEGLKHLLC
eukprot:Seg503.14 transcript_id=Seg503.14/GoldUCD/mRNA.D3Y31 product="DNA repair-scaffolding protein" protein_id=Seg503.14/GoldUCD/D3Y31